VRMEVFRSPSSLGRLSWQRQRKPEALCDHCASCAIIAQRPGAIHDDRKG
jgi:hypothetical protein